MRHATTAMLVCWGLAFGGCGNKDDTTDKPEKPPAPAVAPATPTPAPPPAPLRAVATLQAKNDSGVTGTVTFTDADGKVHVVAKLAGLKPGDHGFHVHEKGDCSSPDGKSAGGHFNPGGVDHGKPGADIKHLGDLGNVTAGDDGTVTHEMDAAWLTLGKGEQSIVGRAVIVHDKADDFGQPTGNAGGRVACGVIELQ